GLVLVRPRPEQEPCENVEEDLRRRGWARHAGRGAGGRGGFRSGATMCALPCPMVGVTQGRGARSVGARADRVVLPLVRMGKPAAIAVGPECAYKWDHSC